MQILHTAPNCLKPWEIAHEFEINELRAFIDSGEHYAKLDYNPNFAKASQIEHYKRALRTICGQDWNRQYQYIMSFKPDGVYIEWTRYRA